MAKGYARITFQSTLPVRGATVRQHGKRAGRTISIHAPREGSDILIANRGGLIIISIHAPREGSDGFTEYDAQSVAWISIHAPREGSDGSIRHHCAPV